MESPREDVRIGSTQDLACGTAKVRGLQRAIWHFARRRHEWDLRAVLAEPEHRDALAPGLVDPKKTQSFKGLVCEV